MIVERFIRQIKHGKLNEALELAKEGRKNIWPEFSCRIFTSNIGTMNTIVTENEFEDMAEREKLYQQVVAKEEWGPWIDRWSELLTGNGANEVWDLE